MNKRGVAAVLLAIWMLLACGCENQSEGTKLTPDQAKELVLERVAGANLEDFWEFETEYRNGKPEYEGTLIYDGMEYEFEIDGVSGAFHRWEIERAERLR